MPYCIVVLLLINILCFYRGNDILGVATAGKDPIAAHAANHLYNGTMPKADEIR
jgi:hypothetical protein